MTYPFFTPDVSGNIASAIPHQFYQKGQFIINRACPLLSMSRYVMGTSNAAYWTISDGGASSGFVGEGEQVNVNAEFNVDDILSPSLNRAILRTGFSLSETELAHVASLDPAITANLVKERLTRAWMNSYAATARNLEVQLLTGQGTATSVASSNPVTGIFGLINLLDQSFVSGHYAGIDLSAHPEFKVNFLNVGGALSADQMDHGFAVVQEHAGSVFDDGSYFLMCSPRTEAALKKVADTNVHDGGTSVRFNADERPASYKQGARSAPSDRSSRISYNNIPVLVNSAWANTTNGANLDGYMVLMSANDFHIDAIPYANKGMSPIEGQDSGVQMFANTVERVGLPLYYRGYAELGGVFAAFATTELQVAWLAPNRMHIWYGITTS